jgi:hypothetical protein
MTNRDDRKIGQGRFWGGSRELFCRRRPLGAKKISKHRCKNVDSDPLRRRKKRLGQWSPSSLKSRTQSAVSRRTGVAIPECALSTRISAAWSRKRSTRTNWRTTWVTHSRLVHWNRLAPENTVHVMSPAENCNPVPLRVSKNMQEQEVISSHFVNGPLYDYEKVWRAVAEVQLEMQHTVKKSFAD